MGGRKTSRELADRSDVWATDREEDRRSIDREDVNPAEFPLVALSERLPHDLTTVVFQDEIEAREGTAVKRTWTITGDERYGLPRGLDVDVLAALFKISKDDDFATRMSRFTLSELLRIMGWSDKGRNYKRVEDALARLRLTEIVVEKAFREGDKQTYLTIGFNMLDEYRLFKTEEKRGPKSVRNPTVPLSNFTWGTTIFRTFKLGGFKSIDLELFYNFKSSITKRLFLYLDSKRFENKTFAVDIRILAYEKLGMPRNYYVSDIKRKLDAAHRELEDARFLTLVEYMPAHGRSENVFYVFAGRRRRND